MSKIEQDKTPMDIEYDSDPKLAPIKKITMENGYSSGEAIEVYLDNSYIRPQVRVPIVTIHAEDGDAEVSFAVARIDSVIEALELMRDRGVV